MKIKKKYRFIDIQTSDLGNYTDIALFVDNIYFIEKIEEVRKILKLDYDYPLNAKDEEKVNIDFDRMTVHTDNSLSKRLDTEVEKIREHFRVPPHFRTVITHAILYGAVGDGSYTKAYLEEKEITPIQNPDETPDIQYNIVIHAGTRKEDVKKVFKEFQQRVEVNIFGSKGKNIKNHPAYGFGYWHDFSLNKPTDIRNKIIPLQKLYRRRKNGETPITIALDNLHLTMNQYKEALYKVSHSHKVPEDELSLCYQRVEQVEKERNKIKALINRYSKLVESSKTIL